MTSQFSFVLTASAVCMLSVLSQSVGPALADVKSRDDGPNEEICTKQADIVFVVDMGHNYRFNKTTHVLGFLTEVVSSFEIAPDNIRIGMVIFANQSFSPFDLDDYTTKEGLVGAISEVHNYHGTVNYPDPLQRAYYILTDVRSGARKDTGKVVILITDQLYHPARFFKSTELIKNSHIKIYTIGIGIEPDYKKLRFMASYPKPRHFFMVHEYALLGEMSLNFGNIVCADIPVPCVSEDD